MKLRTAEQSNAVQPNTTSSCVSEQRVSVASGKCDHDKDISGIMKCIRELGNRFDKLEEKVNMIIENRIGMDKDDSDRATIVEENEEK